MTKKITDIYEVYIKEILGLLSDSLFSSHSSFYSEYLWDTYQFLVGVPGTSNIRITILKLHIQ